jgi:hypothetical protein
MGDDEGGEEEEGRLLPRSHTRGFNALVRLLLALSLFKLFIKLRGKSLFIKWLFKVSMVNLSHIG